jgi:hypothetical protein
LDLKAAAPATRAMVKVSSLVHNWAEMSSSVLRFFSGPGVGVGLPSPLSSRPLRFLRGFSFLSNLGFKNFH